MATLAIMGIRRHHTNLSGAEPLVRGDYSATGTESYLKETASQSWKIDDILYVDTNGTIAIATNSTGKANSAFAGLALAKASGVTGQQVQLDIIRPDQVYVASVWHSTAASAVTVQTQLSGVYGLRYDTAALPAGTAGTWVVDIENTTVEDASNALARVQVVGFYEGRAPTATAGVDVTCSIGDIYGAVLVKFVPFSIATDGSPSVRVLQLA
jgi:hypothetical protein